MSLNSSLSNEKNQNDGFQLQTNQQLSELQKLQQENNNLKLPILEQNLQVSEDKFKTFTDNLPNIDSVRNVANAVNLIRADNSTNFLHNPDVITTEFSIDVDKKYSDCILFFD